MSRFTKALRQRIVRDFCLKNGGHYDPAKFLEEVRKAGPTHEAHSWFEWDVGRAAQAHQVEQARSFARDLRVTFSVQVISGGKRSIKVRESAMPLVISPMEGRKSGGGYVLVDPDDPAFMNEHCLQAGQALRSWLSRYASALDHVGMPRSAVHEIVDKLEMIRPNKAVA